MKKSLAWLASGYIAVASASGATPDEKNTGLAAATKAAREQLATELKIDTNVIETISQSAQTWSDTSLGCRKAGQMYAQAITSGFAFVLKTPSGVYRVHATDRFAVVCGSATQWRNGREPRVPMKALNDKIEEARLDLAKRLSAPSDRIRTMRFTPIEWADTAMDCPVDGERVESRKLKGYRIALSYQGRSYIYHTDLERVRACPPIETE